MVVFSFQTLDITSIIRWPYKYETSFGYRYYPLFDLDDMFLINVEKRHYNDVFYHLKSFFNTWLSWTIIRVKWYYEFFFSMSIKRLLLIDNWKKCCIFRSLLTDVNYRWDTNARYTDRSDKLLIGSMSS